MRALLLVGLLALAPSVQAAQVEFIRVWPGWRDASLFKRISEYFTNRENTDGIVIGRSRVDSRSGFYFLVRIKHPTVALPGAKFILRIITPHSPEKQEFAYPIDVGPKTELFELGLTGPDWPNKKEHPVAWELEVRSASGELLAATESFLWSQPPRAVSR